MSARRSSSAVGPARRSPPQARRSSRARAPRSRRSKTGGAPSRRSPGSPRATCASAPAPRLYLRPAADARALPRELPRRPHRSPRGARRRAPRRDSDRRARFGHRDARRARRARRVRSARPGLRREKWRSDELVLVAAPAMNPRTAPMVTFAPGRLHARSSLTRHFADVPIAMELGSIAAIKGHARRRGHRAREPRGRGARRGRRTAPRRERRAHSSGARFRARAPRPGLDSAGRGAAPAPAPRGRTRALIGSRRSVRRVFVAVVRLLVDRLERDALRLDGDELQAAQAPGRRRDLAFEPGRPRRVAVVGTPCRPRRSTERPATATACR